MACVRLVKYITSATKGVTSYFKCVTGTFKCVKDVLKWIILGKMLQDAQFNKLTDK